MHRHDSSIGEDAGRGPGGYPELHQWGGAAGVPAGAGRGAQCAELSDDKSAHDIS